MNPVSLKVTKFSDKSSRDFQKIPRFSVLRFCDTTVQEKLDLETKLETAIKERMESTAAYEEAEGQCSTHDPIIMHL